MGTEKKTPLITHILGRESTVCIKSRGSWSTDDIFSCQYKQALGLARRYCSESRRSTGESYENLNNIISFVGNRGTGKTSCMLTFANHIIKELKSDGYEFVRLPLIDPSFFNTDYNIIGAFIAKIYSEFEKMMNDATGRKIERSEQQDFYQALTDAQRSYRRLETKKDDNLDDMEYLEQLRYSLRLKNDLRLLVEKYLKAKGAREDSFLIVCIDDLDLNILTGVSMMEWIRKYLIQPNILILMAINMDQMHDLKRVSLYGDYKALIDNDVIEKSEVTAMSDHYLTKIIPMANRVHLPEGEDIIRVQYKVDGEDKWYNDPHEIRETTVRLIFEKTGYLFVNDGELSSLVVPRNLRKAIQFLSMLLYMGGDTIDNRKRFDKYIIHEFAVEHLSAKRQRCLEKLLSVSGPNEFNLSLLYVLKSMFDKCDTLLSKSNPTPEDRSIQGILNKDRDISLGDVHALITWISWVSESPEDKYFLFVVKAVISKQLNDAFDFASSYRSLIGGAIYNSSFFDISKGFFVPKNVRTIVAYDVLSELNELTISKDHMVNLASKDEKQQKRILEFYMLCSDKDGQVTEKVNFDVLSFFYNITDIKACYENFEQWLGKETISDILGDNKNSLWSQFLRSSNNEEFRKDSINEIERFRDIDARMDHNQECNLDNQKNWREWVCPRTYEPYDDFIRYLDETVVSDIDRTNVSIRGFLLGFFKKVLSYDFVKRHPLYEECGYRGMNFNFIGYVIDLIELHSDDSILQFDNKDGKQSDNSILRFDNKDGKQSMSIGSERKLIKAPIDAGIQTEYSKRVKIDKSETPYRQSILDYYYGNGVERRQGRYFHSHHRPNVINESDYQFILESIDNNRKLITKDVFKGVVKQLGAELQL